MKVRVIASLVTALCLSVGSANASSIGVFFAADGSSCTGTVANFTQANYFVGAILGGDAAAAGITGAEFRLDGVNPGWFTTATAGAGSNLALGGPTTGGCNIAWPTCQTGSFVLLYSIVSFVTTGTPPPTTLSILKHTTPSNPNFLCPLVTLCDQSFTLLCVSGGQAFLNGGNCNVAVQQTSWSSVKSLYNN